MDVAVECGLFEYIMLAGSAECYSSCGFLCGRDMQHRLRWADILKWVWQGSGLIDCVISECNQGIGIGNSAETPL